MARHGARHDPYTVSGLLSGTKPEAVSVSVYRTQPEEIAGHLEEMSIPSSIPDIVETIGLKHGGGQYQILVYSAQKQNLGSSLFEITGLPRETGPCMLCQKTESPRNWYQDLESGKYRAWCQACLAVKKLNPEPTRSPSQIMEDHGWNPSAKLKLVLNFLDVQPTDLQVRFAAFIQQQLT